MKRVAAIAASVIFFSLLVPTFSQAAPKAGMKCSKKGITQIYKSYEFKCVKKNGKLVWGKGILKLYGGSYEVGTSNKQVPNSTPTAAPIATPKPSASSNETSAPVPTVNPTVSPSPKRNLSAGAQKALEDFAKYPKVAAKIPPLKFHFSENADKAYSDLIIKLTEGTMSLWTGFYDDVRSYPIIFADPKDLDWVIRIWSDYGYTNPGQIQELKRRVSQGGFTSVLWMRAQGHFTAVLSPERIKGFGDRNDKTIITHHVVHAIHQRLTGEKYDLMGCWATEGAAEFYGAATAARLIDFDYYLYRQDRMGSWVDSKPEIDLRKFSEGDWQKLINEFDQLPCQDTSRIGNLHYLVGMIMTERLVAEFGHEKVMEWWLSMRSNENYKINFSSVFKIPIDEWYSKSAIPYLINEYEAWTPVTWWSGNR